MAMNVKSKSRESERQERDNEMRGVLFKNKKKNVDDPDDKRPHYTGQAQINGLELWVSAWVTKARSTGETYMSMRFEEKENKLGDQETEDDIPF